MTPVIELLGIDKSFPGVAALSNVSLSLLPGRIHALVGENGAGKSTLINILGGNLSPDFGEIRIAGHAIRFANARAAHTAGIVVVHQEVDLFPDLTVAENIGFEQLLPTHGPGLIDRFALKRRVQAALAVMHVDLQPDTLAASLTPAQRQLTTLGAALSGPSRVLILDEPTSSLSAAESAVLFDNLRRLREQGTAILYVSHRLEEIFALADEITVLRDGRRVWHGPLADTSPSGLIHLMVGRELQPVARTSQERVGSIRFRCHHLSAADDSFRDIDLSVCGGEVLGLYGLIGAGRSEWAQAVLGLRPLLSGEIWIDDKLIEPHGPGPMARHGLVYVPEDRLRQGLCSNLSVRANTMLATLRRWATAGFVTRRPEIRRTAAVVQSLGIRLRSAEQPVGTLSGGNQQKVVLGRWLEREPTVLILDEPTRGIDVGAKGEIYSLIRRLADEGRAIVLISSDLPEVLAQSDRLAVFRNGRISALLNPRCCTPGEVIAAAMPETVCASTSPPYPPLLGGEGGKRVTTPPPLSGEGAGGRGLRLPVREAALALLLVLLFVFLEAKTGRFLRGSNLTNLATDTSLLAFCALGASLVLLAGGIDISLGSIMALSAGIAGKLWQDGLPLPLVLLVAIGIGATGGFLNAAISLAGRVHPIVVTLGTLSLYRGLTQWWLEQDVQIPGSSREILVNPILRLPLFVWLGLAVAVLTALFLRRTIWGRQLFAVGSNPAAAARVGVSRTRVWLLAFTLQGVFAGIAGLLYLARSGQVQADSYEDRTLEAVAAAVVGGVAITGGRGSVGGVLLGCVFLVSLTPACQFLRIPTTWQRTLVGAVMAFAVVLDALWRRRRR
jgi:ABC-type sugar transport system ATPase subunit/ribose/xylose/arabinose/galactoside ABC-type transport system permease subunit